MGLGLEHPNEVWHYGHKTVEMGLDAAEALRTQEGLRQRSAAAATDAVVSEVHCLLSYNMCCDCWAYGGNNDVEEAKALVNLTDARSACTVPASFETTTWCQVAVHEAIQILHQPLLGKLPQAAGLQSGTPSVLSRA